MPSVRTESLTELHARSLDELAGVGPVGAYAHGGEDASEPTAWATLALAQSGRLNDAFAGAEWLAERQARDGSVGVTASQPAPGWTTGPAILAWTAVDRDAYRVPIDRAIHWALRQEPWTMPRHRVFGHDTTIEGWSWAPDTHSWVEPTAFFYAALRSVGQRRHPRAREASRLLIDRLLPRGGVNYGNTTVLGQELLQHLQPSGVVAWALADQRIDDPRWESLIEYLKGAVSRPTGVASLAHAVRGLAANGSVDQIGPDLMNQAWDRARLAGGVYKPALVALAIGELIDKKKHADRTEA